MLQLLLSLYLAANSMPSGPHTATVGISFAATVVPAETLAIQVEPLGSGMYGIVVNGAEKYIFYQPSPAKTLAIWVDDQRKVSVFDGKALRPDAIYAWKEDKWPTLKQLTARIATLQSKKG